MIGSGTVGAGIGRRSARRAGFVIFVAGVEIRTPRREY